METSVERRARRRARTRKVVRTLFLCWAVVSTLWLANSMRTRGVPEETLRSSAAVTVIDRDGTLELVATGLSHPQGLIFFCGSGVAAEAYAPLLRPIADDGYSVFIVKLPYRFAPFDSHRRAAVERASEVMRTHPNLSRWVVASHSLGGAIAARMAGARPANVAGLVPIGTTHPKVDDLSSLRIPVVKIFASHDGVAPPNRILATKHLLPPQTEWVEIEGGNHSQFGHYGHQLLDGDATITLSRVALARVTA